MSPSNTEGRTSKCTQHMHVGSAHSQSWEKLVHSKHVSTPDRPTQDGTDNQR